MTLVIIISNWKIDFLLNLWFDFEFGTWFELSVRIFDFEPQLDMRKQILRKQSKKAGFTLDFEFLLFSYAARLTVRSAEYFLMCYSPSFSTVHWGANRTSAMARVPKIAIELFKLLIVFIAILHSATGYRRNVLQHEINDDYACNNQTCDGRPHSSCLFRQVSARFLAAFSLFVRRLSIIYSFLDLSHSPCTRKIVPIWSWCACWHWPVEI